MTAKEQYQSLVQEISAAGAQLVAVSKTKPISEIEALYDLGQRDFGENRVQELVEKEAVLPKDIRWHFIGHLQTKKVKYIASFIHLIHAVDSLKLFQEIDKRARQYERKIECLLQFHIAQEESKYGLQLAEVEEWLSARDLGGHPLRSETFEDLATQLPNYLSTQLQSYPTSQLQVGARIIGVMGMATYTDDKEQISSEFQQLRAIYERLKNELFGNEPSFKELSMGMSGDYPMALSAGSTMVRVGSLLFRARG